VIEYKAFLPESFKSIGNGSAQFVIATTGVVDSDGDVLLPGAIGQQVSTLLPAHNWNSIPLGKAWISERGNQVIADVQFNPTLDGQSWYQAIKWDFETPPAVQQYSWGYTPEKSHPGEHAGQRVRFLEAVNIHETSPVVVGASRGTLTAGVKRRDRLSPDEQEIVRTACQIVDEVEAEHRERLRSIAERLRADEKARYRDRVLLEVNEAQGHATVIVPADTVPEPVRAAAHAGAALAAADLGLVIPQVKWFQQPGQTTLGGRAMPPDLIWLNGRLSPVKALTITGHEVAHCAGRDENGARAYERQLERMIQR
jgi:hypothetical protein